MIRKDDDIYYF